MESSDIVKFYQGRSILITGVTGFVGKGILEKLLRICPEVEKIYVLIRPDSKMDVNARLEKILGGSIFDTVRSTNLEITKKVIPICGDLGACDLGICHADQQKIVEEVSVLISSAAIVKYDENLKLALNVNTVGIQRIIQLCKKMKHLVALVHVSTAYSNCERRNISECVYSTPVNPDKLACSLDWMSDAVVDDITMAIIRPKPNTYTFTKSLAEQLLLEASKFLPISIVRPSIVAATWKEPVPGWVDSFAAATGPMAANGRGVLRCMPGDGSKLVDLSPLDFTVNLILAAAWNNGKGRKSGIEVYNCSSIKNPISYGYLVGSTSKYMTENPLSNAVWYPKLIMNANPMWYALKDFLWHYLPLQALHTIALLMGKPNDRMKKLYDNISKAAVHRFFTQHEWNFETKNTEGLYDSMSPRDKKLFNFNIMEVNWATFIRNYCLGIRTYLFKENISTLPAARERMKRFLWIRNCLRCLLVGLICMIVAH